MADSSSAPLVTDQVAALVRNAYESGNAMLLAVVDPNGRPLLSYRGSTSVFSDNQLSVWARNSDGGTIQAVKENPQVAMTYRSPEVPMLIFTGRARIAEDAADKDLAYSLAHEKERARDPDRNGVAIIIDLDEISGVIGMGEDGPIRYRVARTSSPTQP